jgi:hypothetical protein
VVVQIADENTIVADENTREVIESAVNV